MRGQKSLLPRTRTAHPLASSVLETRGCGRGPSLGSCEPQGVLPAEGPGLSAQLTPPPPSAPARLRGAAGSAPGAGCPGGLAQCPRGPQPAESHPDHEHLLQSSEDRQHVRRLWKVQGQPALALSAVCTWDPGHWGRATPASGAAPYRDPLSKEARVCTHSGRLHVPAAPCLGLPTASPRSARRSSYRARPPPTPARLMPYGRTTSSSVSRATQGGGRVSSPPTTTAWTGSCGSRPSRWGLPCPAPPAVLPRPQCPRRGHPRPS